MIKNCATAKPKGGPQALMLRKCRAEQDQVSPRLAKDAASPPPLPLGADESAGLPVPRDDPLALGK